MNSLQTFGLLFTKYPAEYPADRSLSVDQKVDILRIKKFLLFIFYYFVLFMFYEVFSLPNYPPSEI